MDINRLRGTAAKLGYIDSNFQAMDFSAGFGGF